jgi:uncharacterized spore protein YtfJ
MSDTAAAEQLGKLDAVKDAMSVRRVFGDAYVLDGVTLIPVAVVRGGAGGGGGTGPDPRAHGDNGVSSGGGYGFGLNARPMGVFAVRDGHVQWVPALDVLRIIVGGQIIALTAILVGSRVLRRRRRR